MSDIIQITSDLFSPLCNVLENKSLQEMFLCGYFVEIQRLAQFRLCKLFCVNKLVFSAPYFRLKHNFSG